MRRQMSQVRERDHLVANLARRIRRNLLVRPLEKFFDQAEFVGDNSSSVEGWISNTAENRAENPRAFRALITLDLPRARQ